MRTWTHDQISLLRLSAKDLREAQKSYLENRTQEGGSRVGSLTAVLDSALQNLGHNDRDVDYPDQDGARNLIDACFAMRSAQLTHAQAAAFDRDLAHEAGKRVGEAAQFLDAVLEETSLKKDQDTGLSI